MKRKKALLILGMLYSVCGVGIGAVCYRQKEEPLTREEVAVREEMPETEEIQETVMVETQPNIQLQEEMTDVEEKMIEVEKGEVEEETSEEQTVIENVETDEKKYIATAINVGKSRLRIRESASLQGKIISFMRNGNVAEVIELGEEWHLIRFQNVEGYVSAKYLEVTEVQEETETEEIGVKASE